MTHHIFEAAMMACFAVSWVFSLLRSYRSWSTGGKSILFLWIILTGYVSGITHKLLNVTDYVIILYALNSSMVTADIVLYYRNRRHERRQRAQTASV